MQYTYDTTGQSYFFLLTALLVFLVPFTYSTLTSKDKEREARKVQKPCAAWNVKADHVRRASSRERPISLRHIFVALGWLAFAVVVRQASGIGANELVYDPFKILGISSSSAEKDIKRHYRKLSLKFHPDKYQLADNQTKEEADNHFVELTKAYKALTDEEVRRNYELYGHPDGKQEFSQGIALPSWIVESRNTVWVMGAYALGLGVLLPLLVGRWWASSRQRTKSGILNKTAETFFRGLKEDTAFPELLSILASAQEFASDPRIAKARRAAMADKQASDEYARLVSSVRDTPDGKSVAGSQAWSSYSSWSTEKKRARVLLAAYLLRMRLTSPLLAREMYEIVPRALHLSYALASVAIAHNWLSPYLAILRLEQFLVQAIHPSMSPLRQLLPANAATKAHEAGLRSIRDVAAQPSVEALAELTKVPREELKTAFSLARNWPLLDLVTARFQVIGERTVTPGCIVAFTVKLRMRAPGDAPELLSFEEADVDEDDEKLAAALSGTKQTGSEGEVPSPLVHAPEFPKNRKPSWYLFVGDHKLNRIFVAPHKFTDIGPGKVRTERITFQAPPGPGLYTFQAYVMSDSFVGTDVQKSMQMRVEQLRKEEAEDDDDDISEPDEDTIAGQMALMKGQPVRRAQYSDDDDTSGTDDDEISDSDSSDSDSD